MSKLPRRILIVRLGAIGDVVNALVLANALRDHDPAVKIGWAVHELARPLVAGHPSVDCVHVLPRRGGLRGLAEWIADVRAQGYELAIDLQRILKSAWLARLSGATRVLAYDRRRCKELSWVLAAERIEEGPPHEHMVDQYLSFARALGVETPRARFALPFDPDTDATARARIAAHANGVVLLHVGATKSANRWPAERFGALAARLANEHGVASWFVGGPAEAPLGERALAEARGARGVENQVGSTSLPELWHLAAHARLVISADSGPMHVAAATGTRVLGLFGAADERRTGPYGDRHRVIRERPECAPCGRRTCPLVRHACMLDLTVERVFASASEMLCASPRP
ncbi:MAG: lipopolysaccharide heptosyltransferase II [Planctomycetes bacterium]|nr:lipopolysaccharide heptosyltransferase II [Planctomycetota bacterium]